MKEVAYVSLQFDQTQIVFRGLEKKCILREWSTVNRYRQTHHKRTSSNIILILHKGIDKEGNIIVM